MGAKSIHATLYEAAALRGQQIPGFALQKKCQVAFGTWSSQEETLGGRGADAPNLKKLLSDPAVTKLFHFARFDVAALYHALGVVTAPVICTKIAAKLVRTFTDRHGLKDLCRELLGVDLSKQQQTSDWGAAELSPEQLSYAASDVLHLHALWAKLEGLLKREGRLDLAEACFRFLPARGRLDLLGYEDPDIFHH